MIQEAHSFVGNKIKYVNLIDKTRKSRTRMLD